jgi:thiol-disulfide isomerase/thioredoxin
MGRHSRRFLRAGQLWALELVPVDGNDPIRRSTLSIRRFAVIFQWNMSIVRIPILITLLAASSLGAESPAEQKVLETIKTPDLSVVHLWAPWCSNCQAELKSGGWLKTVKDNPQVKFYFVSVWNNGENGRAMLQKFQIADQPNVTILADPGPRQGDNKIKQFAGIPLSWIPTTWIYKGGDLRYALNYGEVRFDVLQQFLEDSKSEWSHKGEPSIASP